MHCTCLCFTVQAVQVYNTSDHFVSCEFLCRVQQLHNHVWTTVESEGCWMINTARSRYGTTKPTHHLQFRTRCCVKIVANFTTGYHRCLFDKNMTKWYTRNFQEGTLSVLKKYFPSKMNQFFFTSFYYYLKSLKHVASINGYISSCMCLLHTYEISSKSVCWLFLRTLRSDKRSLKKVVYYVCVQSIRKKCKITFKKILKWMFSFMNKQTNTGQNIDFALLE